jgi:hypothetical protein
MFGALTPDIPRHIYALRPPFSSDCIAAALSSGMFLGKPV